MRTADFSLNAESVLKELCLNQPADAPGLGRPVDELCPTRAARSDMSKKRADERPAWKPSGRVNRRSSASVDNGRVKSASLVRRQRQRSVYHQIPEHGVDAGDEICVHGTIQESSLC